VTELSSFSQALFILFFQIAFRLIGEPFSLTPKLFLFFLVDVCMVLIIVSEWARVETEWKIWILKVFGGVMP
jgi:hypothetical protein